MNTNVFTSHVLRGELLSSQRTRAFSEGSLSTSANLGAYTTLLSNRSSIGTLFRLYVTVASPVCNRMRKRNDRLVFSYVSCLDAFSTYHLKRSCPANALSDNR